MSNNGSVGWLFWKYYQVKVLLVSSVLFLVQWKCGSSHNIRIRAKSHRPHHHQNNKRRINIFYDDDRYNSGPNENDVTDAPYALFWSTSPSASPTLFPSASPTNAPLISPTNTPSTQDVTFRPSLQPTITLSPSPCTSDSNGNFGDFTNENIQAQILTYQYEIQLHPTFINPNINDSMSDRQYMQLIIVPALEKYMLDYLIPNMFEHCSSKSNAMNDYSTRRSESTTTTSSRSTTITSYIKALSTQPLDELQDFNCSNSSSSGGGSTTLQSNCSPVSGQMTFYLDAANVTTASSSSTYTTFTTSSILITNTNMTQTLKSMIRTGMELDRFLPAHEAIQKVIYIDDDDHVIEDDDTTATTDDDTISTEKITKLGTISLVGIVLGAVGFLSMCFGFVTWRSRSRRKEEEDDNANKDGIRDNKDEENWLEILNDDFDDDHDDDDLQQNKEYDHRDEYGGGSDSRNFQLYPRHSSTTPFDDSGYDQNMDGNSNPNVSRNSTERRTESNGMYDDTNKAMNNNKRSKQHSNLQQAFSSGGTGYMREKSFTDTKNSLDHSNHGKRIPIVSHRYGFNHAYPIDTSSQIQSNVNASDHYNSPAGIIPSDQPRSGSNSVVELSRRSLQDNSKSSSFTQDSNQAVITNDKSVISQIRSEKSEKSKRSNRSRSSKQKRSVKDSSDPYPYLHRTKQLTTTIQQSTQGSFDFFDLVLDDAYTLVPDQDSHISDIT